jgi:DHA1 family bicyclomycin/chloramphenicol resistance-like MFS transporter
MPSSNDPTSAPGSAARAHAARIHRHAVVLGLLTAIGPFAIDMYLPALPAIGRSLGAAPDAVQASLMAFFLALGAGQLVVGPLSDMLGRRGPMLVGLALFIVASIGCALAPNVDVLIALRFVQGLGACACMVTPRAIVRDLYTGPDAAHLMSLGLTVYSVSPIVAPLFGSFVADVAGWRSVFGAIAVLAMAGVATVVWLLPETRPVAARLQSSFRGAMAGYGVLLRDRQFLTVACMASLALSTFFVYVANSSFVMSTHYGVSPRSYALLFALNAVALVVVSQWNGRLVARFGLRRLLRMAVTAQALVMVALLALTLASVDRLDVLVALLVIGYGCNGVIVPAAFVLGMEKHPALAGTASALIGTFNFVGGAVMVALVSPFANGTPLPMLAGIAACAVGAFAFGRFGLAR